MKDTLGQALNAPGGKKSSTRLLLIGWGFGVLAVFLVRNLFFSGTWDIPQGAIWLLGLLLAGKGVDNWKASQTPQTPPAPGTEIPSIPVTAQ